MTDTRTALLDAFTEALGRVGYPGISMNEVAVTAGIKKPSLYHHFPGGKESLYSAVADRWTAALATQIATALQDGDDFVTRLHALADVSSGHSTASVSFEQRIYDALDHVGDEVRDAVNSAYVSGVIAPVVQLFADAVRAGDVAGDAEFLAMAFLNLTRGASDTPATVALFLDGARPRA